MITIRDLAAELKMGPSALNKAVKKMGITPLKVGRQTETGVQQMNSLTDEQADHVRKYYADARATIARGKATVEGIQLGIALGVDDKMTTPFTSLLWSTLLVARVCGYTRADLSTALERIFDALQFE